MKKFNKSLILLTLVLATSVGCSSMSGTTKPSVAPAETTTEAAASMEAPAETTTEAAASMEAPAETTTEAATSMEAPASEGSETDKNSETAEKTSDTEKVFTKEELAKYDGKNGNPAYVDIDGIVYDVTNVEAWKNGDHNGYSAGADLTEIIKNKSPHGVSVLDKLTIVGKVSN